MKRPSELTIAELKILGPSAVGYAAVIDSVYAMDELQKKLMQPARDVEKFSLGKTKTDIKSANEFDKLKA